jgi:hypothetical protein
LLVHSRELAILVIVVLLTAAGSQLPRLVRALAESPRRAHDDDAEPAPHDDGSGGQTHSP